MPEESEDDLWAMGCVLYTLCTRQHANFTFVDMEEHLKENLQKLEYSDKLKEIISELLSVEAKKRPSASTVKARAAEMLKSAGLPIPTSARLKMPKFRGSLPETVPSK